jgi:hypothetical protein
MVGTRKKEEFGTGMNVKKLMEGGVALIKEQPWSVLPGRQPNLDGRVIPLAARRHDADDILCDVAAANAGGHEAVIWTPPSAGPIERSDGNGVYSNLRWGYTAHVLEGRLIAVQRVVFMDTAARLLASLPRGELLTAPSYHVSSWNGMRAGSRPRFERSRAAVN